MDSLRIRMLKNAKRRVKNKVNSKCKKPNKGQEKRCVDNFRHLGESEVETPLGYIDLLTDKYIVEFKHYSGAKGALGQVLAYSHFVKRKNKMIVLFGKGLSTWKAYPIFERVCASYNVQVYKLSASVYYQPLKKILGDVA